MKITIIGLGCIPDIVLNAADIKHIPPDVELKTGKNVAWMHLHFGDLIFFLLFGKNQTQTPITFKVEQTPQDGCADGKAQCQRMECSSPSPLNFPPPQQHSPAFPGRGSGPPLTPHPGDVALYISSNKN